MKKLLYTIIITVGLLLVSACASPHARVEKDPQAYANAALEDALYRYEVAGGIIAAVDLRGESWTVARGQLDDSGTQVSSDTHFATGSVSKVFTAMALTALLDKHNIALDTPLQELLPGLQVGTRGFPLEGFTVASLLAHRSGLPADRMVNKYSGDPDDFRSVMEYLAGQHLQFPPGSRFSYCNTGYALNGVLIEQLSGDDFYSVLREDILRPTGMQTADFHPDPDQNQDTEAAPSQSMGFLSLPGDVVAFREPIVWDSPAGSLAASAEDMQGFMHHYLSGDTSVLSHAVRQRMETETYAERNPSSQPAQGLGWVLELDGFEGTRVLQHGGASVSATAQLILLPEAGIGVYVAVNTSGGRPVPMMLARDIARILLDSRPEPDARTQPQTTTQSPSLADKPDFVLPLPPVQAVADDFVDRPLEPVFAGSYLTLEDDPFFSRFPVDVSGRVTSNPESDRIQLDLAGLRISGRLQAIAEPDTWVLTNTGTNFDGSTVLFTSDAAGPPRFSWLGLEFEQETVPEQQ